MGFDTLYCRRFNMATVRQTQQRSHAAYGVPSSGGGFCSLSLLLVDHPDGGRRTVGQCGEQHGGPAASSVPEAEPEPVVETLRFSATGDDLIHSPIYKQAARRAANGQQYDFDYCYAQVTPFYAQQDINWINQETLCSDELEPSSYPAFLPRETVPGRFTGPASGCSACQITTPTIRAQPVWLPPCVSGRACRRT